MNLYKFTVAVALFSALLMAFGNAVDVEFGDEYTSHAQRFDNLKGDIE